MAPMSFLLRYALCHFPIAVLVTFVVEMEKCASGRDNDARVNS